MPAPETAARKYNLLYAAVQSSYWASYGAVWSYVAVTLGHYGYSNTEIGIVTSAATLLSIAVQPCLAAIADRSRRMRSREMAVLLSAIELLIAVILIIAKPQRVLRAVLFGLIGLLLYCVSPFFNSMAMDIENRGIALNYGLGRGIGSLFYAVSVAVMGSLVVRCSPRATLAIFLATGLISLVFVICCTLPGPSVKSSDHAVLYQPVSTAKLLRCHPQFVVAMLGSLFYIASHSITNTYFNRIAERADASGSTMGIVLGIAAAMELPAMILLSRWRKRFSCELPLLIASIFVSAKSLLYIAAPSAAMLYPNALLQFFEHGFHVPSTVYYASTHIDEANQSKAQGLIFAAGYGLGGALGNFGGGWCLDRFTIVGSLWFAAFCGALSIICFLLCIRMRKRVKEVLQHA